MPDGDCDYKPEYCVWELTLRCNMRCIHCGSAAGQARENELSLAECFSVADELAALGCRHTTLIGGEVFFYSGWQEVARRLTSQGVSVNVITNGFQFGDTQLEQIRTAQLCNVCLSIDGLREVHNTIRGKSASFDRVLSTLRRLRAEHIPVSVVTTIMRINMGDLADLYKLLASHGVETWQLQLATPMGNFAKSPQLAIEPHEVSQITRFIRQNRDASGLWIVAGDDIGYFDENEMYLRNLPGTLCTWQGCVAGLRAVGIDSVGNVKGCESLYDERFVEGNLRSQTLTEIWKKPGNFAYNRDFDASHLTGGCAGCDKGSRCRGGCRGICHFTSNHLFENPYCCYPHRPKMSKRECGEGLVETSLLEQVTP